MSAKQRSFTWGLLISHLLLVNYLFGQDDWKERKNSEGIQIYTKKVEGSAVKAFKGQTILNTEIATLLKVLNDVETFADWMPNTSKAKLLKKTPNGLIYYVYTKTPWPVKDRDGIYKTNVQEDPQTKVVRLSGIALADYLPEEKGVVRIPAIESYWEFTPLPNGEIQVMYQVHSDPGGTLPAWLANSSVINIPFKTLQGLKQRIRLPQYQ